MAIDSNMAGTRLDFHRGKGGVRRSVSDAIAAIGWDEGEMGYVLVRINRPRGEIETYRVGLREAQRLLEQTIVRYGDEITAQENPIGRLTESGKWEIVALCSDGQPRIFSARDYAPRSVDRRALTAERRFQILSRDAFTCRYCGRKAPEVELHVDHVKPVARGGKSEDSNLVTACADCNHGKSDRSIE